MCSPNCRYPLPFPIQAPGFSGAERRRLVSMQSDDTELNRLRAENLRWQNESWEWSLRTMPGR